MKLNSWVVAALPFVALLSTRAALAQRVPPAQSAADPPRAAQVSGATQPAQASQTAQSAQPALTAPSEPDLPEAIRPRPGGLTSDDAAARAVRASFGVAGARAGLRVAELQQTEAAWAMIPTLSASFRYTRLSDIVPGSIPFFDTASCLMQIAQCQANPQMFTRNVVLQQPILNTMGFRVSMTIPVTDIPFRLREFYVAAGMQAEARRLDLEVARGTAALQGREAYYEYVRALGALAASEQALALTRRRREDILQLRQAGVVAPSEVPAVESAVASAELRVTQARNLLSLMELQLRQRARLSPSEPVSIGESVDATVAVPTESVATLVDAALRSRPELHSVERQVRALDAQQRATTAGLFPSVAIIGNVDVANPNQRIFPQVEGQWTPTWDVTVNLQWTPNQLLSGLTANHRLDAQRAQIAAQLEQLRDGLETEVRAQYNALVGAQASIAAARVALAAARETYRVRRERLAVGASTQTDVADAETQLFNAQINLLNAYVDLRLAAARLRRAAGVIDPAARDAVTQR
jgi:outer membrane protein